MIKEHALGFSDFYLFFNLFIMYMVMIFFKNCISILPDVVERFVR